MHVVSRVCKCVSSLPSGSQMWVKCMSNGCQVCQVCVLIVSSIDPVCFKGVSSVKCVSSVSREFQVCVKRVSCFSSV